MRVDRERLDRALNPKTVVVVGDAKARNNRWLRSNKTVEGVGNLYSVQVDPNELDEIEKLGVENFTSLADVPGDIDYVLVAVPRNVAPLIMRHCIEREVAGAAFFTSGFAETDTDEGRELQATLKSAAEESGLVVIGPNCMGLYNPASGVRFGPSQPAGFDGPVSFVSQSGAHAMDFIMSAHDAGVRIGKAVSFGNGITLENADYLEYFAGDPGTEYLAMYVEGLQDGRAFFEQLRAATRVKPVVLWKGGRSSDGSRATRSHTASLAGSTEVWNALCQQTGAEIGNVNSEGQIVISGAKSALVQALDLARAMGARKAGPLVVSGAFHSSLMRPVVPGMMTALNDARIASARVPVVCNTTAEPIDEQRAIHGELVEQICRPVQWSRSVDFMAGNGVRRFVEMGPGKVLTGLVRRIAKSAEAISVNDISTVRSYALAS